MLASIQLTHSGHCPWVLMIVTNSSFRKFTTVGFLVAGLLLMVSCASAPVQEMSDARQAIQAAKEAGAKLASQPSLQKAEELLKEAEAALQNGEYKKAKRTAKEARNQAMQAQKTVLDNPPITQ